MFAISFSSNASDVRLCEVFGTVIILECFLLGLCDGANDGEHETSITNRLELYNITKS